METNIGEKRPVAEIEQDLRQALRPNPENHKGLADTLELMLGIVNGPAVALDMFTVGSKFAHQTEEVMRLWHELNDARYGAVDTRGYIK